MRSSAWDTSPRSPCCRPSRTRSAIPCLVGARQRRRGKRKALARRYGVTGRIPTTTTSALSGPGRGRGLHRAAELDARGVHGPRRAGRRPRAVREADGRDRARTAARMIDACRRADVKLMIAYRLHFEALQPRAIDIGAQRARSASRSTSPRRSRCRSGAGNIRTEQALGGGTLYDIGIYCINAARYLFRAEPTEALATTVHSGVSVLVGDRRVDGCALRFAGERLATFVTSFNAADVASYPPRRHQGGCPCDPAYEYAEGLARDGNRRRADDPRRSAQAGSVRARAPALLRLRAEGPSAGALGRGRPCRTSASCRRCLDRHEPAGS